MIKIVTRIGVGKVQHAALYGPSTQKIQLFCDSMKMDSYRAVINDTARPTIKNVTCKYCLKNREAWE